MPPETPAGNAANVIGNVVSNKPHPGVVAGNRARAGRSETAALIDAGRMDSASAKPSVAARAPTPTPAAKPDPTPEPEVTPDAEAAPEAETPTEAAPDVPEVAAKPDPETARRVGSIQQAEQRHREKVAKANAELDAKAKGIEREWAPRVKAAEDFEALKVKARKGGVHLVDAIRALGVEVDGFEAAAQVLYAHSPAGAADPARKAQADKLMREREQASDLTSVQRELAELKQQLASKDEQQTFEQQRTTYLDHTVKAIGDDAPIAKALATKNPNKLRAALWATTVELTQANDGDVPDFPEVVAAYEAARRAEFEELGIAPPTATTTTKPNSKPADKQNPAKTLSADLSTPRVPRDAQGGKDHRAETRRMVESGKFE